MATIIVINDSTSEIYIDDLSGQTVDAGGTTTLSDLYTYDEISDSIDLRDLVSSSALILNDGINNLSIPDAIDHLTPSTVYETPTYLTDLPEVPPIEIGKILEGVDSTSCIWVDKPIGGHESGDAIINMTFTSGSKSYIHTAHEHWVVLGSFIFMGTSNIGIPTTFEIIAYTKDGNDAYVKLYDFTNSNEIANITVNSESKQIFTDGSLLNLPTEKSIFEIHGKCSDRKKILHIEAILLRY